MKRSEAYHILGRMWEDATPEQAKALSIAQDDIEFVDLMPEDMVCVVRCRDCKHMTMSVLAYGNRWCNAWGRIQTMGDDGFCCFGERRTDDAGKV